MVDIAHLLRPGHLQQLARILKDPEVGNAVLLLRDSYSLLTHSAHRRLATTGSWPWSS